ncbi:MAG: hypothetical protein ACM30I_00490 [Gemmatimonas sp.]
MMIAACIFLQRFAVPLSDTAQVPAAFVAGYLVFLTLLFRGRLVVNTGVTAAFFAAMGVMTISVIVSDAMASLSSFSYLLSIYVLYLFRLKYPTGAFAHAMNVFLKFMTVAAAVGIAQYALQYVVGWEPVFPFDSYVPDSFLLQNYNVIIPVEYESEIMKANGVFFLEPSFFSQFLGLAILIEAFGRRRPLRLALYAIALLLSYSGTGLLLVGAFLPFILLKRGNASMVVAAGAVLLVVAMFSGAFDLSAITSRVSEFESTESSAFARFISPFLLMRDFVITSPMSLLFGMGSGAIDKVMQDAFLTYLAHDPTWIKVALEYGVPALALFMWFVGVALFHGARNRILAGAIFMFYLFLGGYLLNGALHCLFVVLTTWHNRPVPVRRTHPLLRGRRGVLLRHRLAMRRRGARRPAAPLAVGETI